MSAHNPGVSGHNLPADVNPSPALSQVAYDPTAGPRHNGVLWQDSFIDQANGITPVPFQDVENNDIVPTIGITSRVDF